MSDSFVLRFDGSGKKWAYILEQNGTICAFDRGSIHGVCNMVCEWTALYNGLLKSTELNAKCIQIIGDCKSIIEVLTGHGRHKREDLIALATQCLEILANIKWEARHVPRVENGVVDHLVHCRQRQVFRQYGRSEN